MPVEMIGGEGGDESDGGMEGCGCGVWAVEFGGAGEPPEHGGGEFEDDGVARENGGEFGEKGAAEIAAEEGAGSDGSGEDVVREGGGGALSGRACDGDEGGGLGKAFEEESDLGGDGDTGAGGGEEVWIEPWSWDGGVGHDEVGVNEVGLVVRAEAEGDLSGGDKGGEELELWGELVGGELVGEEDACALGGEEACDAQTAAEATKAHDGDACIVEGEHWGRVSAEGNDGEDAGGRSRGWGSIATLGDE